MQQYLQYSAISARALEFNPKYRELVAKKQEIINSIEQHYKKSPDTILFCGFSPLAMAVSNKIIYITAIAPEVKKLLDSAGIKYTYIAEQELKTYTKKFDWVIASDEYFTFASDESEQKLMIASIADLARDLVVTTLRDYKNQDYKEREFSQPLAVYNGQDSRIFLEYHKYDFTDKNAWETTVYEMQGNNLVVAGPFNRRSMFFKQLAKFSIDAGAKDFYVHKNLMYKSLIKKNYEHVITISF